MADAHAMHAKRIESYMATKMALGRNKVTAKTVLGLLSRFSNDSKFISFKNNHSSEFDPLEEKEVLVPGFSMSIDMTKQEAYLLERSMIGYDSFFNFPVEINFDKETHDKKVVMNVNTVGDYSKHIMKRPRHIVALDVEKLVKYQAFKVVANHLAENCVYQFNPKPSKMPLPVDVSSFKGQPKREVFEAVRRLYIPANKEINELIRSNLTAIDNLNVISAFDEAINQPFDINKPANDEVISKNTHDKPQNDNESRIRKSVFNWRKS